MLLLEKYLQNLETLFRILNFHGENESEMVIDRNEGLSKWSKRQRGQPL